MPKWFDIGKEGVRLCFVTLEKSSVLVLLGLEKDSREWHQCIDHPKLKFKPAPTGKAVLHRPFSASDALRLADLQTIFPGARQIEIARSDDVRLHLEGGAKLSPEEMALAAALKNAVLLGTNAIGQKVFEPSTEIRFVIDKEGRRIHEDTLPRELVLRATEDNLPACVKGFVVGLMSGLHAEASDVSRFVDVLYGAGASADRDLVERVSQAIEAGMAQRLLERHVIAGDGAYHEAQALYENAPPYLGQRKGLGAVPLPMAVATQELLRAFGGEEQSSVYVPRIFDGSLAAMLGNSFTTIADPVTPGSREAQMRSLIPTSMTLSVRESGQPVPDHHLSILNIDDLREETLAGVRENLSRRFASGLSVLLLPEFESEDSRNDDRVRAGTFLHALQRDYALLGLGMVSAVMRKKLGLHSGMVMAIVGHRYGTREKAVRGNNWTPSTVTSMFDWDALRKFTNDVLVKTHEAAGRKLTAAQEAELRANEAIENSYQLPYQSFSANGEVELMIPRNLAGATYKALQRLEDRVGNLDTYVKNAVGFSDEQFAYLAPEQVDADALMIAALDRRKGFILGDQTGAGKGVTLALAVGWAWERGLPVVFITKQDNLFSDFYRDLKKTGLQEKMRPMVLNHSASVVDQFSETLEKVAGGISRKQFLQDYRFGLSGFDNPNLIFATYSQFNAGEDSEKSDWIRSVAPNAVVIFDEAHLAAGDTSNIGEVCTSVADSAYAVVYSSATWLKDARQMRFYQRALPASVDAAMVSNAMVTGGESLQEVFTSMLAEDGLFIRRERDSSAIEIDQVTDEKRLADNEGIANQVSVILQGLQRLCGVTDQVGRRLTKGQTDKLDAAQRMIEHALQRVQVQAAEMRAARSTADAAAIEAIAATDMPEDLAEAAVQATLADGMTTDTGEPAQAIIDGEAQMIEMASAENEDFLAAGEGRQVFTGQGDGDIQADAEEHAANGDDVDMDSPLSHLDDLNFEDLGLSADMTSKIAADLAVVGEDRDAKKRLEREVRRIKRLIASVITRTTSFGSLLFLTQRTLNISLQARFAAERAIEKIRAGEKPVIFLEQTFERRLAEQLERADSVKNEDGTITIKPITLKDNLRELYGQIVNITHVNAEGDKLEGTIMDPRFMASEEERLAVAEGLKTLDDLIDGLPDDLYCSPIDTICLAIRQAGYTVGEGSGRKYHVVDMGPDGWKVALRKKRESRLSDIERDFNFGVYDALVGNKAISTGMSMHASRDFSDTRRRTMLFTQVFQDINDYLQALGRCDRRGQISTPGVEMLASGLPSEARVMMGHYDKLRKLLASTTSNRSSQYEQQELPDLFNSVGDMSVRDFLQANPGVATRLGIDFAMFMPREIRPSGTEVEVHTRGLAKFVVARLDLLPVAESRNVYQEIAHNFAEVVKELDEQGINPLRTNVIDLSAEDARVDKREDLLPPLLDENGEMASVFDESVELHTILVERHVAARSWKMTLADIEQGSQRMYLQSLEARQRGEVPDFVPALDNAQVIHVSTEEPGPLRTAIRMVPSGLRERTEKMFNAMQVMMRSSDAARQTAGVIPVQESTDNVAGIVPTAEQTTLGGVAPAATAAPMGNKQVTPAEVVERRKAWILQQLQFMMPGQMVSLRFGRFGMEDSVSYRGVVTALHVPPRGRETNLSRWSVVVQIPGYAEPQRYTFQELYRAKFTGMNQWLPGEETIRDGLFDRTPEEEFDGYRESNRRQKRYVLRGNLFRAASIAAEKRIGAGGVLQMKNEVPVRVISIRKDMEKADIYASVPVEISREESTRLFCSTWQALNSPPAEKSGYWSEFFRKGLEARGIHSDKVGKQASLSLYWLSTKGGWAQQLDDGVDIEELREQERESERGADRHLIAGIGVRVKRSSFTVDALERFVDAVHADLGFEAVQVMRARPGAETVRLVVRFKDANGERDTPDAITRKLGVVVGRAGEVFGVSRFFAHSPEMRLLTLAVSAQNREQARVLRDAEEEAKQLRSQMLRMSFGEDDAAGTTVRAGEGDGDEVTTVSIPSQQAA
jgi:hypothetical protein